jgi:uncharacterized protein (DUF58 family)
MRFLFWCYRRAAGMRRRLLRRLTPAGGLVLGAWCLISMLATNPGQTVAYQAWVLLTVLLLSALAFAPVFRLQVRVDRALPRLGTAGEPLRYRVRLQSLGRRVQHQLEFGEVFHGAHLDFQAFTDRLRPGRRNRTFKLSAPLPTPDLARVRAIPVPTVPAGGTVEFAAEVLPLRRGPLRFVEVWVGRQDPLGLLRAIRKVPAPANVLILPRRYPVAPGALPGATRYQHGGVTFASGIGESEEFVGVREYRRGDSLRNVHWRVSARLGRPVVREYQDEFFVRHALVLDTFCDASLDGLFEDAVSVAASFAFTVPHQDSLLDLLFVGPGTVCVTAGRGVGHTEHMLEVLACAQPCRDPRFDDLSNLVLSHGDRLSGCLIVLLDWDAPRRRLVARLRALRIPVWALVVVPPGGALDPGVSSAIEQPDRLVVLESGRLAEGLRAL